MATDFYKYGLSTPYVTIEGGITLSEAFASECDAVEQEVRGLADRGWLRYLHLSDLHAPATMLDEDRRQCLAAAAKMVRRLALDFVLLTGDILAGAGGDAQAQQATLLEIREIFADCGVPVIVCRGNHDDNSMLDSATGKPVPENVIGNQWWNWYMGTAFGKASNRYIAPVGENGYYYVDLPEKKIRVVCVNTSDLTEEERLETGGQNWHKVSAEQLTWLDDEALVVPDGWRIICAGHTTPVAGMPHNLGISNRAELYAALEAHKDQIIAYNCGHGHMSANYLDPNTGIRFIMANACGGGSVSAANAPAGFGYSSVSKEANEVYPTGSMIFDINIVNHDGSVSRVRWGAEDDLLKDG